MLGLLGVVVLFGMVFGGFALTGGALGPVFEGIMHESIVIGGAAVGAFMLGNSMGTIKNVGGAVGKCFSGPKWKKEDYIGAVLIITGVAKILKAEGAVALEQHVENPESSSLFADQPRLIKDHFFVSMVCDTLRLLVVSSNAPEPSQIEDIMDRSIKEHHHESLKPGDALQSMADAMPALGIVAAVLGVIKTMGSVDQPPPILGAMIGSALTGTFLGVFLAYGIIGPMASRYKDVVNEEGLMYLLVRDGLSLYLKGASQPVIIEAARRMIPHHHQPTFGELFEAARGK